MLQFWTFLFNVYSDGDVYEGDWVNDLRQGHGIMKFVDGTIYGVSKKKFFPLPVVEIFIIVKKISTYTALDKMPCIKEKLPKKTLSSFPD